MRRGRFGKQKTIETREGEGAALEVNLNHEQHEQINSTRRMNLSPKVIRKHNTNIIKFHEWLKKELEINPNLLAGAPIETIFKPIEDYGLYYDKKELCSALAKGPRQGPLKMYREIELEYERLNPKLAQLYCTSPDRLYNWEKKNGETVVVEKEGKK